MDPFSAIGLAGNIIAFIDFGLKAVDAARAVYKSTTGNTAENEHLTLLARDLLKHVKTLERRKQADSTNSEKEDQETLSPVAERCCAIATDLLALLGALQARKPKSARSSIGATWRNLRRRDDKQGLLKQLQDLAAQLDRELASINRSDTIDRLDRLVATAARDRDALENLQKNLSALRSGVGVKFLGPAAVDQLRGLVDRSDQLVSKRSRQNAILEALKVPDLDLRFLDVAEAHESTFNWLLEAQTEKESPVKLQEQTDDQGMDRAKASEHFGGWLKSGSGIFHISGKPGAGKSTLMKFLCKDVRTVKMLEEWAGNKSLVLSKFFFWNEGSRQQKSLLGLLRGLLYHVLDKAPELIPRAFPAQWETTQAFQSAMGQVPDRDVEAAVDRLMTYEGIYRHYRFAFFIDGLDEFEGDYQQQVRMIEMLFRWTTYGDGDVKACVSSREWNIFLDRFAGCPKLRLHDLTRRDMERTIQARLAANPHYKSRVETENLEYIGKYILDKSNGIFLWVTLVLNAVEEGFENGDDERTLRATLESLPPGLEALFNKLFDSIPPANLGSVIQTFILSMDSLTEASARCETGALRLYQYAFLEEYREDQDWALSMDPEPYTDQEIQRRLALARRRVFGQCKGFLEIKRAKHRIPDYLQEHIILTHRSIAEFLRRKCDAHASQLGFSTFDPTDFLVQTLVAQVKRTHISSEFFTSPEQPPGELAKDGEWENHSQFIQDLQYVVMTHLYSLNLDVRRLRRSMQEIERAVGAEHWNKDAILCTDQRVIHSYETLNSENTKYRSWHSFLEIREDAEYLRMSPKSLIPHFAGCTANYEYLLFQVSQGDSETLHHLTSGRIFANLFHYPYHCRRSPLPLSRHVKMLDFCFRNGAPTELHLDPPGNLLGSWPGIMFYLLVRAGWDYDLEEIVRHWLLLEAFLHFGADADLSLIVTPAVVGIQGLVAVGPSVDPLREQKVRLPHTRPIALLAESRGGTVSLRDLVGIWLPHHAERLRRLIDGNIAGVQDCSGYWEGLGEMGDEQLVAEFGGIMRVMRSYPEKRERASYWLDSRPA